MSAENLRGKTAVVGVAQAGVGNCEGWQPLELMGLAVQGALDDAGIALHEVDGLCATTGSHYFASLSAAEYLGIQPSFTSCDMNGGSSFMSQLLQGVMAIEAGLCKTVVIAYGSNARSNGGNHAGLIETPEWEQLYRPRIPVTGYALAAARHMHEYGTTREQLAEVVVAARSWGAMNPEAFVQDKIDLETVLGAKIISDPLSVMDCCLVTDGAAAMVLVAKDRAKEYGKKAAYVLGSSSATTHRQIDQMPDLTTTAAVQSGERAYQMAGVQASDIDAIQLYDAFSINVILFLEDLGFCAKGEGGAFVSGGRIAPGGERPVNTNGGGISCVHPGMYGLFCMIEAIRQLRGECGDRQIQSAELALAHGNGGTLSSQATTIFGTEACL
ncbi:acetyl-CoA acetyltransferase [Pseudoteredinibacter isoporae]|uniref:Acetyl-CoA acetyltransferase n=1 Tax=Pseudoteredinibacter isoporae TaxID=570281 RepID=A0A7X0MXB9_9GAMM|nr:acetyl-CoA acetyltransferase [Pseudoteredinibacter isoporae]MBB6520742.1 acetyl-CoA acetyltransferase [Pseudoteredinibacter isoporae]NHO86309.1 thiolase [Pseudoteredinibacter isoporae]NIB25240.1 thiolase [Pseudoteredinibacter isoporae]